RRNAKFTAEESHAAHDAVDGIHVQRQSDRSHDQRCNDKEEQEHLIPKRFLKCIEQDAGFEHRFKKRHQSVTFSMKTDSSVRRPRASPSNSTFFALSASINEFAEERSGT